MGKIKITQVVSRIGSTARQKKNLDALGIRKMGRTVVHEASPVILGMVEKVKHLVKVEAAPDAPAKPKVAPAPKAEAPKVEAASKADAPTVEKPKMAPKPKTATAAKAPAPKATAAKKPAAPKAPAKPKTVKED